MLFFGIWDTEEHDAVAEERNGILRFRISTGGFFTMPILLSFWYFIKNKVTDIKMFVIVVMMLLSIYLTLTRQIIAACIFVVFMSFFIGKKHNNKDYVMMLLLIIGLYCAFDALFSEFSSTTMDQVTEDNIRVITFSYFFERDTEDIYAWLIGHGMPKCENYIHEMNVQKDMHLFSSDVGFIGKWFYVGFPFILICYYFLYLLFWKYKKYTPTYIRLFVIFGSVMSIMIFPMEKPIYYFIWTIMAYITDLHINNSPLALETTRSETKE